MRFLFLLLDIAFLAMPVSGQDAKASSVEELSAWYDRLGFEDLSKAKFARVWTGKWTEIGEENQENRLEQDISTGFVVEDDGKTFRVVLADLTPTLLTKFGNDPRNREFCGYREIPLKEEAERLLKVFKNPKYSELEAKKPYSHFDYFNRLRAPARAFVIARECARHGQQQVATHLIRAIAQHPRELNHMPLREWLEGELSYPMLWRGWISFRDPACSWMDLRAKFQRIINECPNSNWKSDAEEAVKEITALLDAEKARSPLPPDDPEELVWKLHEEVEERLVLNSGLSDYWPRPYPFKPRGPAGVIAALRDKGNAAVPALLAELRRPPRPSRSASRYVDKGGGVLRQNTHALAISALEDIAGFNFGLLVDGKSDDKSSEASIAEDWWLAVQQGEEREWLQRHAGAGERQAQAVADALKGRYPADAFEATTGAIRLSSKTADAARRQKLLDQLLALKDRRTESFLLKEFTSAQTLEATMAFAHALRRSGSVEIERRILNAFRDFTGEDFEKAEAMLMKASSDPSEAGELTALRFLLGTHSETTFQAVMEKWPVMTTTFRATIVGHVALRMILNILPVAGTEPTR